MTQKPQWHILRDGQRYGPYSSENLRQFAASGHLLPVDLVQQEGKDQPVVASQIKGLFQSQPAPPPPPPLPPRNLKPEAVQPQVPSGSPTLKMPDLADLWRTRKLLSVGVLLLCSILVSCLGLMVGGKSGNPVLELLSIALVLLTLGLLVAFAILGMMRLAAWLNRAERRKQLSGLWEPVTGQGLVFQFTEDGGMMRSDGLATKFRWLADDQEVELYEDGVDEMVRFKIITLSRDELVLKTGGQAAHFRRGTTISEEEMQRRHEEAVQAFKKFGAGAAKVAGGAAVVVGGAAALLAVGGLAVLCGAAAVASVAGGGETTGGGLPDSSGGTPHRGPELPSGQQQLSGSPGKQKQAVAVTGAVIVRQEGGLCYYQFVCPHCGYHDATTTSLQIPGPGTYYSSSRHCFRCKEQYPVRIQGAG